MDNIFNHITLFIFIMLAINAFLLPISIITTGKYFDAWLKDHPSFKPYGNKPTALQRTVRYNFCICDMKDTNYQQRHQIYLDFDFEAHTRKIDIILATLITTNFIIVTLTAVIFVAACLLILILGLAYIIWKKELSL